MTGTRQKNLKNLGLETQVREVSTSVKRRSLRPAMWGLRRGFKQLSALRYIIAYCCILQVEIRFV